MRRTTWMFMRWQLVLGGLVGLFVIAGGILNGDLRISAVGALLVLFLAGLFLLLSRVPTWTDEQIRQDREST